MSEKDNGNGGTAYAGQKKALELAQKKMQIVGNMTRHDVLNQLTVVMGYNELVGTMVQDEKILHFLELEGRATEKIRRIFAYSKVFQNIGTEPPQWQDLGMLVKLARDELDTGDIRLHIDAGTCSILADPLFSKVLSYLIDNAVRHGKKTTEIRISLQYAGGYAVLFIEDNGAGIVPEDKEKIFEKGYGKYTGWGLFVAREILAANGMTIRETGEPGKGARFEIAVPQERVRFKTGAAAQ